MSAKFFFWLILYLSCQLQPIALFFKGLVNATLKTSSTFFTVIISIFFLIVFGTSNRSFLFSRGIKTFNASSMSANNFSLTLQLAKQFLSK